MQLASMLRPLEHAFPVPQWLHPFATGVDISDTSIKWLTLKPTSHHFEIKSFGSVSLEEGIVKNGRIIDSVRLARALRELHVKYGIQSAHAALPEEEAFVFTLRAPHGTGRGGLRPLIEFELETRVPLPLNSVVFDSDVIGPSREAGLEDIGVIAFPKTFAEEYAVVFESAGIALESLEIEARSIARSVCHSVLDETVLLIDYGFTRTGLAVVRNGIPLFTSTVDVGGKSVTDAVTDAFKVDSIEVQRLKNDEGLVPRDDGSRALVDVVTPAVNRLGDELTRALRFWTSRKDERGEHGSKMSRAIMVGGSANLRGITDFASGKLSIPVQEGEVWKKVFSLDAYIPPIDKKTSLQYATALGLAMRSLPEIS